MTSMTNEQRLIALIDEADKDRGEFGQRGHGLIVRAIVYAALFLAEVVNAAADRVVDSQRG
jgi:hypothetical protein